MSERISIVVPDGTRKRLADEAKKQGRSQSNLSRKFIMDGLSSQCVIIKGEDVIRGLNINRSGI